MKRIFCFSLLAIFVLLSVIPAGCSKLREPKPKAVQQERKTGPEKGTKTTPAEKVPALKPGDFFPLVKGFSWEYLGEGNEYASFSRKVLYTDGNFAQIREDNGGTVLAAVFKTTDEAVTRIFFLGEAYGETNYLTTKPTDNTVILKAPLKVGTKWADPTGTREIVDLEAAVNTPAGDFAKCLKVKISNTNSTVYEYFKDGVGMVKREFISGEARVTSSLKKFR